MQPEKTYRIHLVCPRCSKTSETVGHMIPPPRVNCGDCLVEHAEVVQMLITAVGAGSKND